MVRRPIFSGELLVLGRQINFCNRESYNRDLCLSLKRSNAVLPYDWSTIPSTIHYDDIKKRWGFGSKQIVAIRSCVQQIFHYFAINLQSKHSPTKPQLADLLRSYFTYLRNQHHRKPQHLRVPGTKSKVIGASGSSCGPRYSGLGGKSDRWSLDYVLRHAIYMSVYTSKRKKKNNLQPT